MSDLTEKNEKNKDGEGGIDKAKDAFISWSFSAMYSRFSLGSGVRSLG